jgi:hypothetical protein
MNQDTTILEDIHVDTTSRAEWDEVQFPNEFVTVTLTVTIDTCSIEVERFGQSLAYAKRKVKKTTTLFGAAGDIAYERQRFSCVCPTMAAARQACRDLERLAHSRFQAEVSVDEEEFKILAVPSL